jgi:secondary thiamine-phosphate synthase enzyme
VTSAIKAFEETESSSNSGKCMTVEIHNLPSVRTSAQTDIIDITPQVREEIQRSAIRNGHVTLFVPGSTGALTTIEYESGVINDLRKAIERIAPRDLYYEHDERWGDGNGYSHVRAALLGPSLHIPIIDGRLTLGTWQQIVLLDFDNRPRNRKIIMQMVGE